MVERHNDDRVCAVVFADGNRNTGLWRAHNGIQDCDRDCHGIGGRQNCHLLGNHNSRFNREGKDDRD